MKKFRLNIGHSFYEDYETMEAAEEAELRYNENQPDTRTYITVWDEDWGEYK